MEQTPKQESQEMFNKSEIDTLLNKANSTGSIDTIMMGPDGNGGMDADSAFLLQELNNLGWKAPWQETI
ncbi:MAG: hypothetical protein KBB54_03765 [Candidatus Pacebacteria bacterium]|nr:hypothetical protein [Candidatus Paceibacterota bacterium]